MTPSPKPSSRPHRATLLLRCAVFAHLVVLSLNTGSARASEEDDTFREAHGGSESTLRDSAPPAHATSAPDPQSAGLVDVLPTELQTGLAWSTAPAFSPNGDHRDLRWMLVSQNAQRAVWQGLLGARRVRELERARFEMDLVSLHPDREIREDEDYFRDLCETVGRSVGKVLRERLERRLNFDDAIDRARGRTPSSRPASAPSLGWRFSPRIDVGSRNRLGVKFSFRDGAQSWRSRMTLQLSHDFEEDLYMKAVYNGRRAEAEVRYVADDLDFGETVTFDVRFGLGSLRRSR